MVSRVVDSPVHVDIVMHMDDTSSNRFSYTAYMNEKFSLNLMSERIRSNENYVNLSLDISEEEYHSCNKYLSSMVDRVEYNRSDAMLLLPIMPSKGLFVDTMITDVDGSDPSNIKSVYCSQAVVLVMRECLKDRASLMEQLDGLNSRLTSPCTLYTRLKGYCDPLVNSFFE